MICCTSGSFMALFLTSSGSLLPRIPHDLLHLWVIHGPLPHLLRIIAALLAILLYSAILVPILCLIRVRVKLHCLAVYLHGFLSLAHSLEHVGLPQVSLDKGGIQSNTRVAVFDGEIECIQFSVACCSVGVYFRILGIPFQCFGVKLHGVSPVARFKAFVSF